MQEENSEQLSAFATRLTAAAENANLLASQIAERLGATRPRVSNWFRGKNFPRARERSELARLLGVRKEWLIHGHGEPHEFSSDPVVNEAVAQYGTVMREVPVVSWAHAGQAVAYEELPKHFRGAVSTMSRDPRAFAITVEGDSMEPKVYAGDRVICEPSNPPVNGKPVVAKLGSEEVQLRIYHKLPSGKIRLAPLNPVYPTIEYDAPMFAWIYPVKELSRAF